MLGTICVRQVQGDPQKSRASKDFRLMRQLALWHEETGAGRSMWTEIPHRQLPEQGERTKSKNGSSVLLLSSSWPGPRQNLNRLKSVAGGNSHRRVCSNQPFPEHRHVIVIIQNDER